MRDLSALGQRATLSLKVDNDTLNDLVLAKVMLKNVGAAPIPPEDFRERLSVSVRLPARRPSVTDRVPSGVFVAQMGIRHQQVSADGI
jgi:hypothetical protein